LREWTGHLIYYTNNHSWVPLTHYSKRYGYLVRDRQGEAGREGIDLA
jgi:hypothetical protein